MSEITIQYYGHSCFRVLYQNHSIVFDPYQNDSVPGIKLPSDITADVVSCSHQHGDHNAQNLIHLTGMKFPFETKKLTVPHDDAGGLKRGMSDITFVQLGHSVLVHLGDIGREPTEEEYRELSKADILMIPAGGYFTIDSEMAETIMRKVHAKLNILMHYRNGEKGYPVLEDIRNIRKNIPDLKEKNQTSISFDENSVPEGTITLTPIQ